MKKLLSAVIIGIALFTSCEKEKWDGSSLTDTRWATNNRSVEVTFTDTHATITETYPRGVDSFTGTYTYDPPKFIIVGDVWHFGGVPITMPYQMIHKGTIEGKTMEIFIQAYDQFMITYLTKQ